jgi:Family of unknown function (DUF5995)
VSAPYRSLDDVVDGLGTLEADLRAREDRRSIFVTLYGIVSVAMRDQAASGAFDDPSWVQRYAVGFANLYREAFERYEAGDRANLAKAWRLAFDAAGGGRTLVLQDLLLGVNAHVNHDLPYALTGVSIDPDRASRYRDHTAVNRILASVTDRATARIAALYAPGLSGLDDCAGEIDELLSRFSLEVARESAWESALGLANARGEVERQIVMTVIGSRAAAMAKLLLAPSLSPTARSICARLERGLSWAKLAAVIRSVEKEAEERAEK